jgi:hypothetical protein
MPYSRHKPVSEEEMLQPASEEEMQFARYAGHHTICQTLREIWAASSDDDIKMKCRLAIAMAKAMNTKLKAYRAIVDQENVLKIEKGR